MNLQKSIRMITRNKTYSILNIMGLAIGITAAALIFLWVESQVNYNRAIPDSQNIYLSCYHFRSLSGECSTITSSNSAISKVFMDEFPEVKRSSRYLTENLSFLPEGETTPFHEQGAYADSTLFAMLDMKWVAGDIASAFNQQHTLAISRSMAQKIYGHTNPVGKGLLCEKELYEVVAVFEDMPANTDFQFEWVMPFELMEQKIAQQYSIDEWGTTWLFTYVELYPDTDLNNLNAKLKDLAYQKGGEEYKTMQHFLYPLNRLHLYGRFIDGEEIFEGLIKTVTLFALIGVLILAIACINFMNLSTARSQKRALEVGVRKTFGTKKPFLIRQFMIESAWITAVALLIAVGLIELSLPWFNELIDTQLSFSLLDPKMWIALIAIGLFCTLLAGSYPAFYLSSFEPLTTLKMQKMTKGGRVVRIRQGLVVFQFAMTFILIFSTVVIYQQIQLVQQRDLGMKLENLIRIPASGEMKNAAASVRNELLATGMVEDCGFSMSTILKSQINANPWTWNGKEENDEESISVNFVSEGFLKAAGMELIEGRNFESASDRKGVIINETLAKRMGKEGRIGGMIGQSVGNKKEIIGIVKDFVFDDLSALKPGSALFFNGTSYTNWLFVRIRQGVDRQQALAKIGEVMHRMAPTQTYEPLFMTDYFNSQFEQERFVGKLSGLFALLAILISCLGLLGLSAFSAEQRTKEIGIRKVLGATTWNILYLLGKSYLLLLLISFFIAMPIAYYAASRYLQDYAYRIALTWDLFVAVALFVVVLALLTVSALSLRAAWANPAKSIKTE